ncbi:unnamed protein product [Symbiodinium sp. KB8]|nr:unnamed protein product [Symbiodinium sp. KB8]
MAAGSKDCVEKWRAAKAKWEREGLFWQHAMTVAGRYAKVTHVRQAVYAREIPRLLEDLKKGGQPDEKHAMLIIGDLQNAVAEPTVLANTLAATPDKNCVKLVLFSNTPSKRHARARVSSRSANANEQEAKGSPNDREDKGSDDDDEEEQEECEGTDELPATADGWATFRQSAIQKTQQLDADRKAIAAELEDAFGTGRARQSYLPFVMVYDSPVSGSLTTEGCVMQHAEADSWLTGGALNLGVKSVQRSNDIVVFSKRAARACREQKAGT